VRLENRPMILSLIVTVPTLLVKPPQFEESCSCGLSVMEVCDLSVKCRHPISFAIISSPFMDFQDTDGSIERSKVQHNH